MDDLDRMRQVIETIDIARDYLAKCREMGDVPGEDFAEDYVEVSALASWNGEPPWQLSTSDKAP